MKKCIINLFDWIDEHNGGVIAILTIFLMIINVYTLWQTQNAISLTREDITVRNRPYLEITNPLIKFYDSNGRILTEGTEDDIASIRSEVALRNSNDVPAEIVTSSYEINGYKIVSSNNTYTIFKEKYIYPFEQDKNGFIFANLRNGKSILITFTINYRIHGSRNIYTSVNVAECRFEQKGNAFKIPCSEILSYTT